MQVRKNVPTRARRARGDLLDRKWLTYLLTLILILLIAFFVVSLSYQGKLVHYAEVVFQRAKKALRASFGLNTRFTGFSRRSIVSGFIFFPRAFSLKLCDVSPVNLSLPLIYVPDSKLLVAE